MIRVWMNNWFSQSADIISLIKEENPDVYIIATNGVENPAIQKESDEWYIEGKGKASTEEEYIEYALEFCKEHKIDILMPLRKMVEISKNREEFRRIGVKLIVPSEHQMMEKLNSKIETYRMLEEIIPNNIPAYGVANNVREFEKAVDTILDLNRRVCFKYAEDIACRSFRIIEMGQSCMDDLSKESKRGIKYRDAIKMFSSTEEFKDIIVMELLDGYEVSCDCLRVGNKNIVIPRIKLNTRIQEVSMHKKLIDTCNNILDTIKYDAPCNIQFKMTEDGEPMLLEINTRMSGGVQIASWATKINLPSIAINKFLGREVEFKRHWEDVKMVVREKYDIIKE